MKVFRVKMSDIRKCPILSISPRHYRRDGSCRCIPNEPPRAAHWSAWTPASPRPAEPPREEDA